VSARSGRLASRVLGDAGDPAAGALKCILFENLHTPVVEQHATHGVSKDDRPLGVEGLPLIGDDDLRIVCPCPVTGNVDGGQCIIFLGIIMAAGYAITVEQQCGAKKEPTMCTLILMAATVLGASTAMGNDQYLYENMTPEHLKQAVAKCPVAYLPTGIPEWHGEQNACGLDALKAETLGEMAASMLGGVCFPTVWTGRAVRRRSIRGCIPAAR